MIDIQPFLVILMVFAFISVMRNRGVGRRQRRMQDEIERMQAERAIAAPSSAHVPGPSTEQMRRLEERVRVLERIVTDPSQDLAREIEDLRDRRSTGQSEMVRPEMVRPEIARPEIARPDIARPDIERAAPERSGAREY